MSDWKEVLAPSPECIDIARLGDVLDGTERAHLETCARCQSELALFREMQREESSPEEARDVEWIAEELRRRNNVVSFRPRPFRMLYAAAAAIVMLLGAGYWMQMREPAIHVPIDDTAIYRSVRLDVIAPVGELVQAPNELRWTAVPNATRYHVQILEVDAEPVWSGDTTEPHVALPPAVIQEFAPGKSLLWDVKALRGNEVLASSETQTVRVSVTPLRKDP